jgi:hypothetical protein
LTIAGCAHTTRGDASAATVVEARLAASRAEALSKALEEEIRLLRQQLVAMERDHTAARREQARLVERIDRLLELGQRTGAPAEADRAIAHTLYQRELPPPSARQVEQRAILRAIDRLDLSTEQKQSLLRMLDPPRQLDDENPWNERAEWH